MCLKRTKSSLINKLQKKLHTVRNWYEKSIISEFFFRRRYITASWIYHFRHLVEVQVALTTVNFQEISPLYRLVLMYSINSLSCLIASAFLISFTQWDSIFFFAIQFWNRILNAEKIHVFVICIFVVIFKSHMIVLFLKHEKNRVAQLFLHFLQGRLFPIQTQQLRHCCTCTWTQMLHL